MTSVILLGIMAAFMYKIVVLLEKFILKEKKKKVKKERLTFKQWIKTINKENTKAFLLGTGEKRGFLQNVLPARGDLKRQNHPGEA